MNTKRTDIIQSVMAIFVVVIFGISMAYTIRNYNQTKRIIQTIKKETKQVIIKHKTNNAFLFNKSYLKKRLSKWIFNKKVWKDGYFYSYSEDYSKRIADAIVDNTEYPMIILSIVYVESKFNSTAKSSSKAIGLGQISLIHVNELMKAGIIHNSNGKELYDIVTNIRAANFVFLQKLKIANGNIMDALSLYSANANGYADKIAKTHLQIMFYLFSSRTIKK